MFEQFKFVNDTDRKHKYTKKLAGEHEDLADSKHRNYKRLLRASSPFATIHTRSGKLRPSFLFAATRVPSGNINRGYLSPSNTGRTPLPSFLCSRFRAVILRVQRFFEGQYNGYGGWHCASIDRVIPRRRRLIE